MDEVYVLGINGETETVFNADGSIKFFNINAARPFGSNETICRQTLVSLPDSTGVNTIYLNTKYKFTAKERDAETGYDYFGARYYDSRIGRWLQVDPLFEKHPNFSPYNYVLNNPLKLIDPDGKQSTDWWKVLFRAFVRVITKPIKNEAIDEILKKNDSKDMLGERPLGSKGEDIDNDGIDDSRDGIDNRDYFKEMVKFKKMEDKINESFRKSVEEGIKKGKQNLFQKPFQQSEENKTTETSNYELDYPEPNEPLSPIELREDKTENIRR